MRYIQRLPLPENFSKRLASKTSLTFSLSKEQKKKLKNVLLVSQKSLCCYCESIIGAGEEESHFEHFIEQHDNKNLVHDYNNLLLSCYGNTKSLNGNYEISCGCGKERGRHGGVEIDYSLLLNPAENNVNLYYYSLAGNIVPSIQCSDKEKEKVNYTIKRLSLDSNRLIANRLEQIDIILEEIKNLSKEERLNFISSLLNENKEILTPFYSTMKDTFGFILNSST